VHDPKLIENYERTTRIVVNDTESIPFALGVFQICIMLISNSNLWVIN